MALTDDGMVVTGGDNNLYGHVRLCYYVHRLAIFLIPNVPSEVGTRVRAQILLDCGVMDLQPWI